MNVPPETDVYISFVTGTPEHESVRIASQLRKRGFNPIPHVAVRNFASAAAIDHFLGRLANEAGVTNVLAIAGDRLQPAGWFASSMDLLGSGLLTKHRILKVGFAGYPDGHPLLSDDRLDELLQLKLDHARQRSLDPYVVTQFCFDPIAINRWLGRLNDKGIHCKIRIGLAGPTGIATLLKFAIQCGIGNSIRLLERRSNTAAHLVQGHDPDTVLRGIANFTKERLTQVAGIHLFPFGGLSKTARWAKAVKEGRFRLTSADGFEVSI